MDRGLYIFLLVFATYSPEEEFGVDEAIISLSRKEGNLGNLPLSHHRMNGLLGEHSRTRWCLGVMP
jgi:hypothetical protein